MTSESADAATLARVPNPGSIPDVLPTLLAKIELAPDVPSPGAEVQALRRATVELIKQLAEDAPLLSELMIGAIERLEDARELFYVGASIVPLSQEARQ